MGCVRKRVDCPDCIGCGVAEDGSCCETCGGDGFIEVDDEDHGGEILQTKGT